MSSSAAATAAAPAGNFVVPPKKPKLSKAERRALQEQQRASKAGGAPPKKSQQQQQQQQQSTATTSEPAKVVVTDESAATPVDEANKKSKQISLLSHLPPYRDPLDHPEQFLGIQVGGGDVQSKHLHPAVLAAGRAYATQSNMGGNARCRLLLEALQAAIQDYVPTPKAKDVRHDISNVVLKPSFAYWTHQCRPHSVSMGNAFSFVKSAVAALDRDIAQQWTDSDDAKLILKDSMEQYVQERVQYADQAIAHYISDKSIIQDGDVILTYANYEVIAHVLLEAARRKIQFRVILVDSKPLLEGQSLLRTLREDGNIDCTYILLNALSFVMKDVTKVLLGAEALMNDGSVYARVGTACVASCCKKKNKSVLVCAETYKISHRVQLEAITNNELGNPKNVLQNEDDDNENYENLRVMPLLYDLTPADFVSGIVTEMGILPPTSVAVLLREMNPDAAANSQDGGF